MAVNEITLPVKAGSAVFVVNDVDPFRVLDVTNAISGILSLETLGFLSNLVDTDGGAPGRQEVQQALPGIILILQKTDSKTLKALVKLLLCDSACKYRVEGVNGWNDFESDKTAADLFTGYWVNLFKLLAFSFKVNFRPLSAELKKLPSPSSVSSNPSP